MDMKAVVVPGEAPESDEDTMDVRTGLAFKYLTNAAGTIISGEAAESDDEGVSVSSASTAIDAATACSIYGDMNAVNSKKHTIKYNSLLHKKLYECNESLRNDVLHLTEGTVTTGIQELTSINKQLVKSELTIQEAACQLRNASSHWHEASSALFQLVDANFLSNIKT